MNILFLTAIILTVALVQEGHTAEKTFSMIEPCKDKDTMERYTHFVQRHILKENFAREDRRSWESYLMDNNLCDRAPVQSFIEGDEGQVQQICHGGGQRVRGATGSKGNLCINKSKMTVYDVKSREQKNKCKVTSVKTRNHPVVVACNEVNNQCLPVHYEKYTNQRPDNQSCM